MSYNSEAHSSEKPSFRYDLSTEAVSEKGQRFVDVSCADTGKAFRFYEVEYALACGMDGERDVDALVAWAKAELDLDTNATEVKAVVAKLAELQYLEGLSAESTAASEEPPTPVPAATAPVAASAPAASAPVATPPPMPSAPIAAASEKSGEFGLGAAGTAPLAKEPEPLPAAPDFELGVAGGTAKEKPALDAGLDMELGAAGNEDEFEIKGPSKEVRSAADRVSTDLSQTFRIDKDEVKAAVRASKVMSAVDIPADLAAELDEPAAASEPVGQESEASVPEPVDAAADISSQIAEEVEKEDGQEAIVLPEKEPSAAKAKEEKSAEVTPPKAAKPEKKKSSTLLFLLLLLAIAAAGGYYYYENFYKNDKEENANNRAKRQVQKQKAAQKPVKKAKVQYSTLIAQEAPVFDSKAGKAGTVAWTIENGSEVKAGDLLLKLDGFDRFEKEHNRNLASLEKYSEELAGMGEEPKDKKKASTLKKNVERKTADVAASGAKLDPFLVKAENDGVLELLVNAKDKVAADQSIAKITGKPSLKVEFAKEADKSYEVEQSVKVYAKASKEQSAECKVASTTETQVVLECPGDAFAAETAIAIAE